MPAELEDEILRLGEAAVQPLLEVLQHALRDEKEHPSAAAFHAGLLLARLECQAAIPALLRLLVRSDASDLFYEDALASLATFGAAALEPALAAHAAAANADARAAVCDVLADLGVHDPRAFAALARQLGDAVEHGAMVLARYGDAQALPLLSAAFDRHEVDLEAPLRNHVFVELREAITELGGTLTPAQRAKVARADEVREAVFGELDDLAAASDEESKAEAIEAALQEFEAAHPDSEDTRWIEMMFQYGAEGEGATPETFDRQVLESVLFEWIPRKVSCSPDDASEIIASLKAYWTFARAAGRHPAAAECLEALGGDAADRLRRALADTSKFGMAKSFFMRGEEAGFDVTTEEGLAEWVAASNAELARPPAKGADKAKKKKLKKLKKKAQRRNRR